MKKLLDIATSDTHFSFDGKYYRQHNGVAMGSPLAPLLADIFMIQLENKLMTQLRGAEVMWYKRYVDDTFVLVDKNANIDNIKYILNSYHPDIQFTSADEKDNELPFLDVLVHRDGKYFTTSVYRKPTYTGLLTKWSSFVPRSYKVSAVSWMVYRAIQISSSYKIMDEEFDFIRKITKENGYPSDFVECQIRHTLNRFLQFKNKVKAQVNENNTSKDKIIINVPFVGNPTKTFIKDIRKLANQINPTTQVIAIPRPPPAVRQLFKNKDSIPKDS